MASAGNRSARGGCKEGVPEGGGVGAVPRRTARSKYERRQVGTTSGLLAGKIPPSWRDRLVKPSTRRPRQATKLVTHQQCIGKITNNETARPLGRPWHDRKDWNDGRTWQERAPTEEEHRMKEDPSPRTRKTRHGKREQTSPVR